MHGALVPYMKKNHLTIRRVVLFVTYHQVSFQNTTKYQESPRYVSNKLTLNIVSTDTARQVQIHTPTAKCIMGPRVFFCIQEAISPPIN